MRIGFGALGAVAALVAGGCAHHTKTARAPDTVAPVIGESHSPFRGKPAYLATARPLHPESRPQAANDNPCARRSTGCDDRLRANLAAIDGELLALSTPPSENQLKALAFSLGELRPLLAPYTDVTAEADELADDVDKLANVTPVEQGPLLRRMFELTDLIRVQLAAAQ
ncbi:MAG: hypothetical protein JWL71_2439 [Acidobacteria bacterium]|nr:hypothetical protein [Acidobacteriota bacterium]